MTKRGAASKPAGEHRLCHDTEWYIRVRDMS